MGFSGRFFLFLEGHSEYFTLGLVLVMLCLVVWNLLLSARLRKISGMVKKRSSVDDAEPTTFEECLAILRRLTQTTADVQERCGAIEAAQRQAVRNVGLVRFDAFDDVGGEQSFSLALLDGQENGLVLSSLFGRSESRMYAKPVNGTRSEHVLTSEEQEAIKRALK